jgi:hypothetical protein
MRRELTIHAPRLQHADVEDGVDFKVRWQLRLLSHWVHNTLNHKGTNIAGTCIELAVHGGMQIQVRRRQAHLVTNLKRHITPASISLRSHAAACAVDAWTTRTAACASLPAAILSCMSLMLLAAAGKRY